MFRCLSIVIIGLGTMGAAYCVWALHRVSPSTLTADSDWPQPWPYPDRGLTALHDWYDARHPAPPGSIKIHGELLRVRLIVWAALAFCSIPAVAGVGVRLTSTTVVGNYPERLRRLKRLLFAHLAAVTCCAVFTDINGSGMYAGMNMLFTALVGSELCLLGLGMAAVVQWPPRWKPLSLLVTGTGWVWLATVFVLVRTGSMPPSFLLLLPPFVSLAAFGFGLAMRGRSVGLVSVTDAPGDASEPLQFTLRHLLVWVSTTAVLLAIARGLHSTAPSQLEGGIAYTIAVLGVMSVLTAGIVLATLWATLGSGRPVYRLPLAIALAAIGGLAPAYCFDRPSPWAYVALAIVAVMLSGIVATTLLAVRQCGYRLVDAAGGRE